MARAKKRTETETDFNPAEFDPAMQPEVAAVVEQVAAATEMAPEHQHAEEHHRHSHAAGPQEEEVDPASLSLRLREDQDRREPRLPAQGGGGRRVGHPVRPRSDTGQEAEGETPSKEEAPHAVLKMLKSEGYRWGFDGEMGREDRARRSRAKPLPPNVSATLDTPPFSPRPSWRDRMPSKPAKNR
jgi:hypothetical protein